jgi:predicted metal-dependent hydrolase
VSAFEVLELPFGIDVDVEAADDEVALAAPPRFTVEVVRSVRRRKTVQAQLVGDTVRVFLPARLSWEEEQQWIARMLGRFERAHDASRVDLGRRAAALAGRLGLPLPSSIRWVGNQRDRWGSCTPADGDIRLSDRLAAFPRWVLDYVIVHELAHLAVADHSPAFWSLVERYPKAERARGFLIAKGLETAD